MGTGSVEVVLFPCLCVLPTVPVPIFHPAISGPVEKGDRHPADVVLSAGLPRVAARSQSPFSTHRLQFEFPNLPMVAQSTGQPTIIGKHLDRDQGPAR